MFNATEEEHCTYLWNVMMLKQGRKGQMMKGPTKRIIWRCAFHFVSGEISDRFGIERIVMYLDILKIVLGGPVHRTDEEVAEMPGKNLSVCSDDESLNQGDQRQRIKSMLCYRSGRVGVKTRKKTMRRKDNIGF